MTRRQSRQLSLLFFHPVSSIGRSDYAGRVCLAFVRVGAIDLLTIER